MIQYDLERKKRFYNQDLSLNNGTVCFKEKRKRKKKERKEKKKDFYNQDKYLSL